MLSPCLQLCCPLDNFDHLLIFRIVGVDGWLAGLAGFALIIKIRIKVCPLTDRLSQGVLSAKHLGRII